MQTARAFCNASVTRNLQVTITSVRLQYKGCVSGWAGCHLCALVGESWHGKKHLMQVADQREGVWQTHGQGKKHNRNPGKNCFFFHFACEALFFPHQSIKRYLLSHSCQSSPGPWTNLAPTGALVRNTTTHQTNTDVSVERLSVPCVLRRLWKSTWVEAVSGENRPTPSGTIKIQAKRIWTVKKV